MSEKQPDPDLIASLRASLNISAPMTPTPPDSPRPAEPSEEPAQRIVRESGIQYDDDRAWLLREIRDLVTRTRQDGAREALEAVAKAICDWCAREHHVPKAEFDKGFGTWVHKPADRLTRDRWNRCQAPEVWDALQALRGGKP